MPSYIKSALVCGLILSAILFVVSNAPVVVAEVMFSNNYQIRSDSLNFGGGQSNSSNYKAEYTLGEVATGDSGSNNFKIRAGYQQMDNYTISMSEAGNVSMSPSLGGITGGTSNGQTSTTVTTDNPTGYELYIKASSSPAMQGDVNGDTIANYLPAGIDPDFSFSVLATDAEFGFTPEGTDIASRYRDNGVACAIGSGDTVDKCWDAVNTSNSLISVRNSGNFPAGTETTVKFRLTVGSSAFKIGDVYTATTTLTAVSI